MTDADAPAEDEQHIETFMAGPKYPDIHVKLTGQDSNTGNLMGLVSSALKARGVAAAEVRQFRLECLSGDYSNALNTMGRWVEVS